MECPEGCGRKFNKKALETHTKACKIVFMSKRKEFNSQAKRISNKEQVGIAFYSGNSREASQTEREKVTNCYEKSLKIRLGLENPVIGLPRSGQSPQAIRHPRRRAIDKINKMLILREALQLSPLPEAPPDLRLKEIEITPKQTPQKAHKKVLIRSI